MSETDGFVEFGRLNFADGQISEFRFSGQQLWLHGNDWQGKGITLIFDDLVGMELFDIVGEDLSHSKVSSTDPFIERASRVSKDNVEGLLCFSLYSAWSDEPLVRIVARDVKILRS